MSLDRQIGERISQHINVLGIGQGKYASEVSLPPSTLSSIVRGAGQLTLGNLHKIAERWGLSMNWLVFGIGPMTLAEGFKPLADESIGRLVDLTVDHGAPGLEEILRDDHLLRRAGISLDEAAFLAEQAKDKPELFSHLPKVGWLHLLFSRRMQRSTELRNMIDELNATQNPKSGPTK